jgi:hypothetical protein
MKSIYSDMALDTAMATTKYVLPLPCHFSVARSTRLYLAGFILLLSDTGNGLLVREQSRWVTMVQLEALVMEGGQEEGVAWPILLMISKSHFTCSLLLSPTHVPYMCRGGISSHPIAGVTNNLYS